MIRQTWFACAGLLVLNLMGSAVSAQEPSALTVAPDKVTMLVGETHTFRAVGRDGRMRHNVRWSVTPDHAATLAPDGDEVILQANEAASSVVLTAYADSDMAQASIEIRLGTSLATGTVKWSVAEIPGCKTVKIIPAVPSAGGPDVYVREECPQGTFVRAIMEDGRELWRRRIGGPGAPVPSGPGTKEDAPSGAHLNLSSNSVCDGVSVGMTKEGVAKLVDGRSLRLDSKQRLSDSWGLEEEGTRCTILFVVQTGIVVKKKKTIITD